MDERSPSKKSGVMWSAPRDLNDATEDEVSRWEDEDRIERLWAGDVSLWSGDDEDKWMGWLHVSFDQQAHIEEFLRLQREVSDEGFEQVVLLGMGGASLCAEVLRWSFGKISGAPDLQVLDSTDPAQVLSLDSRIDYQRTVFIVSSKSGTTLESSMLLSYFVKRVGEEIGEEIGSRFLVVTDPGSELDRLASMGRYRHIFHGVPSIGGRYSALSNFGMVPAAVMGLNVGRLLDRAEDMRSLCSVSTPLRENQAAMLGLILGTLAQCGRNKMTFVISPVYARLGAWLEQLLAESTGKDGLGLIPVDGETIGPATVYGGDRVFIYIRDETGPERHQEAAVSQLEQAGQPVIRLGLQDRYDLGAEFYRWEFATAVAGSVLGLNPFDQPDVEASKVETRRLTTVFDIGGTLPTIEVLARTDELEVYTEPSNFRPIQDFREKPSVQDLVTAHCERIRSNDYVAILAFVERTDVYSQVLQRVRLILRDALSVATCVGFGPRFLHSTGQVYKGGPDTGVFFLITCDDPKDVPVPERNYTFGAVKAAQALGDFRVLVNRGRRVLRLHASGNLMKGLESFEEMVTKGLSA